jgi:hypothetical protein
MRYGGLLMLVLGALLYVASWAINPPADARRHDATPSLGVNQDRVEAPERPGTRRALAGLETMMTISSSCSVRSQPNP